MMWIIMDLDGTLCNTDHRIPHLRKEPKDWERWNQGMAQDIPYYNVAEMLIHLTPHNRVAIITGRFEQYRDVTVKWLAQHGIRYEMLLMRPDGDFRSDAEVKLELAQRWPLPPNQVLAVFEDRSRVVTAWRAAGYFCCQVREGDY